MSDNLLSIVIYFTSNARSQSKQSLWMVVTWLVMRANGITWPLANQNNRFESDCFDWLIDQCLCKLLNRLSNLCKHCAIIAYGNRLMQSCGIGCSRSNIYYIWLIYYLIVYKRYICAEIAKIYSIYGTWAGSGVRRSEHVQAVRFGSAKMPNTNTKRSDRSGVRRTNQVRKLNRGNISLSAQDHQSLIRHNTSLTHVTIHPIAVLSLLQLVRLRLSFNNLP